MWKFLRYMLGWDLNWGGGSFDEEPTVVELKTEQPKPQVVTTSIKAESPYRNGFKKPAVNKRFVPFDRATDFKCHCGCNDFWAWQSNGGNQNISCCKCGHMWGVYGLTGTIQDLQKVELDPRFY